MPPASPVPGWSIGDVCTLIIATRRTASAFVSPTPYLLEDPAPLGPTPSNLGARPVIPGGAEPSQSVARGALPRWESRTPETRPTTAPKRASTSPGSDADWCTTPNTPQT